MPALLNFVGSKYLLGYRWSMPKTVMRRGDLEWRQKPEPIQPWNPRGSATPWIQLEPIGDGSVPVRLTTEDSALFQSFASMEPTEVEILEFVNRYGTLGSSDSFQKWEFEVRSMHFLVEIWEASGAGRRGGGVISEHFPMKRTGGVKYPFPESILQYPPARTIRMGGGDWKVPDDPLDAARWYLNEAINVRLRSHGAEIELGRAGASYDLTVRPKTLLAALWLQFALAIAENKQFRRCQTCGVSFELEPDINRTSRFYCDNACRVKAYRQRQAKAQRLHKRGRTVQQVAKELKSDSITVKKWLKRGE